MGAIKPSDFVFAGLLFLGGLYLLVDVARGNGSIGLALAAVSCLLAALNALLMPFETRKRLQDFPVGWVAGAVVLAAVTVVVILLRLSSPEDPTLKSISYVVWGLTLVLMALHVGTLALGRARKSSGA